MQRASLAEQLFAPSTVTFSDTESPGDSKYHDQYFVALDLTTRAEIESLKENEFGDKRFHELLRKKDKLLYDSKDAEDPFSFSLVLYVKFPYKLNKARFNSKSICNELTKVHEPKLGASTALVGKKLRGEKTLRVFEHSLYSGWLMATIYSNMTRETCEDTIDYTIRAFPLREPKLETLPKGWKLDDTKYVAAVVGGKSAIFKIKRPQVVERRECSCGEAAERV